MSDPLSDLRWRSTVSTGYSLAKHTQARLHKSSFAAMAGERVSQWLSGSYRSFFHPTESVEVNSNLDRIYVCLIKLKMLAMSFVTHGVLLPILSTLGACMNSDTTRNFRYGTYQDQNSTRQFV